MKKATTFSVYIITNVFKELSKTTCQEPPASCFDASQGEEVSLKILVLILLAVAKDFVVLALLMTALKRTHGCNEWFRTGAGIKTGRKAFYAFFSTEGAGTESW